MKITLILAGLTLIEALLIYILFKSRSNYKKDFNELEKEFEKEMALSDAKIIQLTERLENYNTYISEKENITAEKESIVKELKDENISDEEKDSAVSDLLSSL